MGRMRAMVLWCLVLAAISGPARADDLAVAREHYQNGNKAYEVGEYDEAVREFTAAYKAHADPAILFNLAQSQRLAGHPVEAERAYRMFLMKVPDSPQRPEIEKMIERLAKEKPGAATLDDPDIELVRRHFRVGAELYAQEKYVEAVAEFEQARAIKPLPTLDFNIARCYDRLERLDDAIAAYQRYAASTPTPGDVGEIRARIAALSERRARKASAAVEKPAAPPPVEKPATENPAAPAPAAPSNAGRGKRIGGIVLGVIGLGALGAGIGMSVLSQSENDRLSHPTMGTRYDTTGLAYQNASIALYVVGGAALVTGVVLFVVGQREAKRPPLRAQVDF